MQLCISWVHARTHRRIHSHARCSQMYSQTPELPGILLRGIDDGVCTSWPALRVSVTSPPASSSQEAKNHHQLAVKWDTLTEKCLQLYALHALNATKGPWNALRTHKGAVLNKRVKVKWSCWTLFHVSAVWDVLSHQCCWRVLCQG